MSEVAISIALTKDLSKKLMKKAGKPDGPEATASNLFLTKNCRNLNQVAPHMKLKNQR